MIRGFLVAAVGFAVVAACSSAHAAEVTPAQAAYCSTYAEASYQAAVAAGSALPDDAYEGAAEECELQWLALGAQWDDPANLARVVLLATAEGVASVIGGGLALSYEDAMARAKALGACYVEQSVAGWVVVQECDAP